MVVRTQASHGNSIFTSYSLVIENLSQSLVMFPAGFLSLLHWGRWPASYLYFSTRTQKRGACPSSGLKGLLPQFERGRGARLGEEVVVFKERQPRVFCHPDLGLGWGRTEPNAEALHSWDRHDSLSTQDGLHSIKHAGHRDPPAHKASCLIGCEFPDFVSSLENRDGFCVGLASEEWILMMGWLVLSARESQGSFRACWRWFLLLLKWCRHLAKWSQFG